MECQQILLRFFHSFFHCISLRANWSYQTITCGLDFADWLMTVEVFCRGPFMLKISKMMRNLKANATKSDWHSLRYISLLTDVRTNWQSNLFEVTLIKKKYLWRLLKDTYIINRKQSPSWFLVVDSVYTDWDYWICVPGIRLRLIEEATYRVPAKYCPTRRRRKFLLNSECDS